MAEPSDATLESLLRLVESKPDAPISREIDPADDMYAGSVDHYFAVSASALRAIRLAMIAGGKTGAEAILDLPSGYGRVLRSLRAAFPQAEITACDLNRGAVDYCAGVFGAVPVYGDVVPESIEIPVSKYDLIWSGSLLTHLDADQFVRFIRVFERSARVDGLILFTTHGRRAADFIRAGLDYYGIGPRKSQRALRRFERKGFAYCDYPNNPGYGMALSSPRWVVDRLTRSNKLRIVWTGEAAWDRHQDVFAVLKVKE